MGRQPMKEFKYKFRIPWSDTDAAGVVHFANYFKYFERAELELYHTLGFAYSKTLMKRDIWLARVEAHCSYVSPCEFDDEVEVTMSLLRLGEKSLKYGMKVFNITSNKEAAEGHITVVSAFKEAGKAIPLPDDFRSAVSDYFNG